MPLPIRNKKWNSEQTGHYKELLPYPKQSTLAQNRKKRLSRPSFCQKFARDIRKRTTTKILGGYDHWSQFTKPPTFFLKLVTPLLSKRSLLNLTTKTMQHYHNHQTSMLQFTYLPTESSRKKERKKCCNPCLGSSTTSIAPFVKFL